MLWLRAMVGAGGIIRLCSAVGACWYGQLPIWKKQTRIRRLTTCAWSTPICYVLRQQKGRANMHGLGIQWSCCTGLAAQAQPFDEVGVARFVFALQVVEQLAALGNHF